MAASRLNRIFGGQREIRIWMFVSEHNFVFIEVGHLLLFDFTRVTPFRIIGWFTYHFEQKKVVGAVEVEPQNHV